MMDKGVATLIVGILAGVIGLISALLSHLSLRFQLKKQAEESISSRQHSLKVTTLPKVTASVEEAWYLLDQLQENGILTEQQTTSLIKSTLWLPDSARVSILLALKEKLQSNQDELISVARKELITITEDFFGGTANGR